MIEKNLYSKVVEKKRLRPTCHFYGENSLRIKQPWFPQFRLCSRQTQGAVAIKTCIHVTLQGTITYTISRRSLVVVVHRDRVYGGAVFVCRM